MSDQVEFDTGDIVRLKSGGPEMTVQNQVAGRENSFSCQWFAGKKLERGTFPAESLELVTEESE